MSAKDFDIVMGGYYQHCVSGIIMRVEEASSPTLDDSVWLVRPTEYCQQNQFIEGWRGNWKKFSKEWERVDREGNRFEGHN